VDCVKKIAWRWNICELMCISCDVKESTVCLLSLLFVR